MVEQTGESLLSELDWDKYGCQCPVHECGNRASRVVKIHALHACDKPWLADGNRVEFRCSDCLTGLIQHVAESLSRIRNIGVACCATCGAPIFDIVDVIREVGNIF